jgi:hypothetical protein
MGAKGSGTSIGPKQRQELLEALRARFEENMTRHEGVQWEKVQARLEADSKGLWSLLQMEATGGEPDVVGQDKKSGAYLFYDCAPESPAERRSLCYDGEALEARKKHKPKSSAVEEAMAMGAALLSEEHYSRLQDLGEFDAKTSSWLLTPPDVRRLGGAIFGDYRYGRVFVFHNGADSYYASRGFRCMLSV